MKMSFFRQYSNMKSYFQVEAAIDVKEAEQHDDEDHHEEKHGGHDEHHEGGHEEHEEEHKEVVFKILFGPFHNINLFMSW